MFLRLPLFPIDGANIRTLETTTRDLNVCSRLKVVCKRLKTILFLIINNLSIIEKFQKR